MAEHDADRSSLKGSSANTDHNGQDLGQDSPLDVGTPSRTQAGLKGNPAGEAETARIASGMKSEDATDQTEAETPPENLRAIRGEGQPGATASEAIDRATAAVGQDDGKR
ncbi:hypothetical protein AFCDBAGC_4358 [Methylobacterium cerastii]|uniref:Uncharacterized protein n=1 Tax=Methylobacterium cerastii TaxID=932741 RepID=A0ABQ4QP32_9HYPH|nr:hypothetical protein FV219_14570 [Methylobacterium sp. WL122]TXN85091.1 hypothetical protein FV234_00630 [Methylobacterium sp. WL8]GJD46476.1 hypothetical protein AFCDBAGC_4358 [Methylobacterium cerastii]